MSLQRRAPCAISRPRGECGAWRLRRATSARFAGNDPIVGIGGRAAARVAQGSRVETGPASQPNNPDEIRIDGRAIAIDREGKEHPNENGKFTAWIGPGVDSRNETVQRRRRSMDARREAQCLCCRSPEMKLGSEAALVSDGTISSTAEFSFPPMDRSQSGERGSRRPHVRVVDGAGGGAISNVSVVTGLAPTRDDAMDPSTLSFGTAVVATGDSPCKSNGGAESSAKSGIGFALRDMLWESLEIDHVKGGEHTVALEHEGTLRREMERPPASMAPPCGCIAPTQRTPTIAPGKRWCSKRARTLHRREHAMDPDAQFPCGTAESIRIDAIKRGRYLIAIEVGDKDARPFVLGERWIDVALGDSGIVRGHSRQHARSGLRIDFWNLGVGSRERGLERVDKASRNPTRSIPAGPDGR